MVKAGWRTTEFWLTVSAHVVGAVLASGAVDGTVWAQVAGVAAMALASLGYSASRGLAKGGES